MTTVLKLGGSVITDKDEPETIDRETLDETTEAISAWLGDSDSDRLVLVHGGGSFGHHHAAAHGVSGTEGTREAEALTGIHSAMTELNDAVVATLQKEGVPAVPVQPFSAGYRDADGSLQLPSGQVETMLAEEFVPVLHGDVISHVGKGATVLSGDEIVVSLAESLGANRVGLCSTVPGVLDNSGEVIPEIDSYDEVAATLGESDSTDVTGGMAGKVDALLSLDVPASIFSPDSVAAFLRDEDVGTVIFGGESR